VMIVEIDLHSFRIEHFDTDTAAVSIIIGTDFDSIRMFYESDSIYVC
jgi:hypothetical protein